MKNIKLYFIAFVILFLIGAIITINIQKNRINKLLIENNRVNLNYATLANDRDAIQTYNLKLSELGDSLRKVIINQAEALKIKPKQIEKVVYVTQTIHDTINSQVPVYVLKKNEWLISDSAKCFEWKGRAVLSNGTLNVKRTDFTYHNTSTETFYKKRPFRFLFIKYGKWQYMEVVDSECGQSAIKTINFIK